MANVVAGAVPGGRVETMSGKSCLVTGGTRDATAVARLWALGAELVGLDPGQ